RPFQEGELYTLDSDPNSWHGYYCGRVVKGLLGRPEPAGPNTLYDRFTGQQQQVAWPEAAAAAQQRFLAGLEAFWKEDLFHGFEVAKRNFISPRGDAPLLLVQGPPGDGEELLDRLRALRTDAGGDGRGRPRSVPSGLPDLPQLQDARRHRRSPRQRAGRQAAPG